MTEKPNMAEPEKATVGNLGGAPSIDESLSALMDDSASEVELHRVLRAASSESGTRVRATWSRYQMVSSTMKGDMEATSTMDLSGAIRNAIADEDSYGEANGWMKSFGRFAVAASVAAVVVVTTQLTGGLQEQSSGLASVPSQPASKVVSLPAGFQAPALSARTVSSHDRMSEVQRNYQTPQVGRQSQPVVVQPPSIEVQSYLLKVMEAHAANASQKTNLGILPYARVPAEAVEQQ